MNREEMLERLDKGEDPLEVSIQKWLDISYSTGEDDRWENCGLCEKFYEVMLDDENCAGCPVKQKTGREFCQDTPYADFRHSYSDEQTHDNSVKMLEFLIRLRSNKNKSKEEIKKPIQTDFILQKIDNAAIQISMGTYKTYYDQKWQNNNNFGNPNNDAKQWALFLYSLKEGDKLKVSLVKGD